MKIENLHYYHMCIINTRSTIIGLNITVIVIIVTPLVDTVGFVKIKQFSIFCWFYKKSNFPFFQSTILSDLDLEEHEDRRGTLIQTKVSVFSVVLYAFINHKRRVVQDG